MEAGGYLGGIQRLASLLEGVAQGLHLRGQRGGLGLRAGGGRRYGSGEARAVCCLPRAWQAGRR